MSETKHTPGPWRIDGAFDADIEVEIIAGDDELPVQVGGVCIVAPFCENWREQEIADAHLIAAAPELLEALKQVRQNSEGEPCWCTPSQTYRGEHTSQCKLATVAIAKAEGRA